MTLQESLRFSISQQDSKAIWKSIDSTHSQPFKEFLHFGPYRFRFNVAVQHQLHCLQTIHTGLSGTFHTVGQDEHMEHCFHYLRQTYLCYADPYLEAGDFMARNYTVERVQDTRICRDWQLYSDFRDRNFQDWLRFNGIISS